jgi:AsmA protein
MKTLMRWIAILVGGLLLLSIGLSVLVMIIIDPNDYKDEIAAAVTEQTGRTFTIEGDLTLKTFPCCGIALGPLALGNPTGFPESDFASVEVAAVDVQLWPLLTRQELRVGAIELTGFDLQLISRANGTNNWDFSSVAVAPAEDEVEAAQPGGGLAALDIAGIEISKGRVSFLDETAGEAIRISAINLTTGAIRTGQPFDLSASLQADGLVPGITAKVGVTAQVTVDAESQLVDLVDVSSELELQGDDLPGGSVSVMLGLDSIHDLGAKRVPLQGLAATLQAAGIRVNINGEGVLVDNNPEIAGTVSVARFNPRELLATLGAAPLMTADPEVMQRYEMQGNWSYAGDKAAIENIVTTLDDSEITGWVRVNSLKTQALAFDLELDNIDLDRYMAPTDETASNDTAAVNRDDSLDLPVEDLRALNMQGRIGIGQLKFADARLNDVRINLKAKNGLIRLNPLTAVLYDGGYSGDIRLDVRGAKPALSVDENLSGVQLATLLVDLRDQHNLSGTGNVSFTGTASGDSVNELLANLSGNAALDLQDGIYQGTDIWYEIRKTRAQLKNEELPVAPENPQTEISQFSGTAKFVDGVLKNDHFAAQIPFIRLGGVGDIDLLGWTIDYRLEGRVVETPRFDDGEVLKDLQGLVLPITLKGNMDAPTVGVDLTAIAVSIGQNKLRDRLRKKLGIEDPEAEAEAGQNPEGQPATESQSQTESQPQQEQPQDDPKEQLKKSLFDLLNR